MIYESSTFQEGVVSNDNGDNYDRIKKLNAFENNGHTPLKSRHERQQYQTSKSAINSNRFQSSRDDQSDPRTLDFAYLNNFNTGEKTRQ